MMRTRNRQGCRMRCQAVVPAPGQRNRSEEQGMTLLEVLVVTVILLVGILSVIRVFPVGFDVVERGGQLTLGSTYAQLVKEQVTADPAGLPDSIAPAVCLGGTAGWPHNPGIWADSLKATDDGLGLRGFENSVFQFRRIIGESARVGVATISYTPTRWVTPYVLRFAPLEDFSTYLNPLAPGHATPGAYDVLSVYAPGVYNRLEPSDAADPNNPRRLSENGNDDLEYSVEYVPTSGVSEIRFEKVGYRRVFKIDYTLYHPTQGTRRILGDSFWVRANYDTPERTIDFLEYTLPPPQTPAGWQFVEGTEVLHRRLSDWPAEGGSTADPYGYAVVANNIGKLLISGECTGWRLAFTYTTMDWQILHDDVDVPAGADVPHTGATAAAGEPSPRDIAWVKLSFPFIERDAKLGPVLLDAGAAVLEPLPSVLIQDITPNSSTYGNLIGADQTHSSWTFDDYYDSAAAPRKREAQGQIGLVVGNWVAGQRVLSDGSASPFAGVQRVRIYYRTQDGYAVQLMKPSATYARSLTAADVNHYLWDPAADNGRLLFAPCDGGKDVSIDYTYQAAGGPAKVSGAMHTIDTTPTVIASVQYAAVRLQPPGGAQVLSVDAVRGASVVVRVVWPAKGRMNPSSEMLQAGWGMDLDTSDPLIRFWGDDGVGRWKKTSASASVAKPSE